MRNQSKLSILPLLATLLLSFSTHGADESSMKGRFKITHSNIVFKYKDASKGYELNEMHTKISGQMRGHGLLSPLAGDFKTQTDGVLGRDIKGQLQIRLNTEANPVRLECRFDIRDAIEGIPAEASARFNIPLILPEGGLADLKAGRSVTAQSTPAGEEQFLRALRSGLTDFLGGGLSRAFGANVEARVPNLKLRGPMTLTISPSTVTIDSLAVSYDLAITASR